MSDRTRSIVFGIGLALVCALIALADSFGGGRW